MSKTTPRSASIREAGPKYRRPYAAFELPAEVFRSWQPYHRDLQFALAIVAANDVRMRRLSAWPGESADDLKIRPGLVYAAEGGVSIWVRHVIAANIAFGRRESGSTTSRTEFRLFRNRASSKDGDFHTWHATTERMAELIEEFAAAYLDSHWSDYRRRIRAAGRRLSVLSAEAYRRAEKRLERDFGSADTLWAMLGQGMFGPEEQGLPAALTIVDDTIIDGAEGVLVRRV